MSDEIIAREQASRNNSESLGDLMDRVVGSDLHKRLRGSSRAEVAWYEANGDLERAHTCGVSLVPAKKAGGPPRMIVYVDSNVMLSDFRTNAELYLGRLAMRGLQVSSLEFRLSRKAGQSRPAPTPMPASSAPKELPPLTPAQEREIEERTADLPDETRKTVRRTMSLFYRRDNLDVGCDARQ